VSCCLTRARRATAALNSTLGAKGVVELELVSSGEKWGRGPAKDVHSSLEAQVDSPSWHLIQALNTLVEKDGPHAGCGGIFSSEPKPLSEAQKQMVLTYAATVPEDVMKKELGVQRWVHDLSWQDSLLRLYSQPTINIEGLVGGYTGARAERRCSRTGRSPRSTCASCPT